MSSTAKPIPVWAQILVPLGVIAFMLTLVWYSLDKVAAHDAELKAVQDQKDRRAKAAELVQKGFEQLKQERRNAGIKRCQAQGDVAALFIDKVICLKGSAVSWQKYDTSPEQDEADELEQAE